MLPLTIWPFGIRDTGKPRCDFLLDLWSLILDSGVLTTHPNSDERTVADQWHGHALIAFS